ncbi:alpha/beta fold hydrolase [Pseudoalteromonas sp. MMG005]|uniref:alpha/beta hydrolase n=1 Tax=Pseudoalteromonas sp. MMG005 TaxID=2822682 RepID=UPI001B3A2167|nr:alpha/beta fold hydrolase [Pseudoalteromonas sp. MMG005]MBQ4844658.1 alpha/beta fold hydrolase [Pseudoalteromonas sp. MMG005]
MSSKIYFSDKSDAKRVRFYAMQILSKSMHSVMPRTAQKYAKKLLMTPVRHNVKQTVPARFKSDVLASKLGPIHVISAGEGPVVLFTHGWSGSASQFYALMDHVVALGFKVVAFDHYAHGQSGGDQANLPKFICALNAVLEMIAQPVKAIISHSMGGIAALNSNWQIEQHILIAPPFDFYTGFRDRILSIGIVESLFTDVLASIENEHDMKFSDLLPEQQLINHSKITIIHDIEDKFARHDLAYEQAQQHAHIDIYSTQGLGHGRILNSQQVWRHVGECLMSHMS